MFENYADAFLACRDLGHAWMEDEFTRKKRRGVGTVVRVLGCGRCNTTRIDSFNFKGELLSRAYRQPKGYRLSFRPLSAKVRAERFKRLAGEGTNKPTSRKESAS